MDDYIDRNNAIECIENEVIRIAKMLPDSCETRNLIKGAKDSIDTLKHMLSVDAVEVTRCEFCEHWDDHNNLINQCEVHKKDTGKFYFCASGVKKNEIN